jgi:hypothetical protein
MTISLRQLFAATLVIGPAIGIGLSNGRLGVVLAVLYIGISIAVLFTVNRTVKTWSAEKVIRRVYGVLLSMFCIGLWLFLLANIVGNPTIHRTRVASYLQSTLSGDERFGAIRVEYVELKPKFLNVTGTLKGEDDFLALRQMISARKWNGMDGVYWRLRIQTTNRDIDEWDWELVRL